MTALLLSLAFAAEPKSDLDLLQGTWLPTAAEIGTTKMPAEALKTFKLVIQGEKYTVTAGGMTDLGTVKVMPKTKPKSMDITGTDGPNKGKTLTAIYELDGDNLRVCYNLEGKDRPKEFATGGSPTIFLAVYERMKK